MIALPSPSIVKVGYQRLKDMLGRCCQVWVTGSKVLLSAMPRVPFDLSWPPATSSLPSARCTLAEQKMFENGFGTSVIALFAGFHNSP